MRLNSRKRALSGEFLRVSFVDGITLNGPTALGVRGTWCVRRLECPECGNIVSVGEGESPVCSECGFSGSRVEASSGYEEEEMPSRRETRETGAGSHVPKQGTGSPDAQVQPGRTATPTSQPGPRQTSSTHAEVGKFRKPIHVVLLSLVTFGIYRLYWLWKVSDEIDRFAGEDPSAHKPIKWGVIAGLLLIPLLLLSAVVYTWASGLAETGSTAQVLTLAHGRFAIQAASHGAAGVFMVFFLLAVPAIILLYLGMWRIWSKIRKVETERGHPDPFKPGVNLALNLVPIVNIVGIFLVDYWTQDRFNKIRRGRRGATGPR